MPALSAHDCPDGGKGEETEREGAERHKSAYPRHPQKVQAASFSGFGFARWFFCIRCLTRRVAAALAAVAIQARFQLDDRVVKRLASKNAILNTHIVI